MKYETSKYLYDFQQFQTIRSFGDNICIGKVSISEADKKQSNLLTSILKLNNKARPRSKADKEKNDTYDSAFVLYEGRELTLNAFRSGIFPLKSTQRKGLKISTSKKMSQSLPIALAQAKVGNTSENLLNEIRPIIYSLYLEKGITKKVYKNIINSIKL